MPAILVVSNMKSGLPKPVHSALPMPLPPAQAAGSLRGSAASLIPLRSPVRRPGTRAVPRQSRTEKGKPGDPQIYTDWANHYLAKSGGKRLIRNLQQDVSDGVLLAEIIQVVANEKIADINDYPESRSQMIENIDACLVFLAAKGVNINGLRAEEIRSGNLKAILGLFFSLSRFKQQQRPAPPQAPPAGGPAQTPHPPRPTVSPAHRHQAESSRLPGPSVRVGAVGSDAKPRGGATGTTSASTPSSSSSSSNRRSQSFNSGERLKPTHPACALHEDGVRTPPSMAEDGAPYAPDLPTPTPTSSSSSSAPASSSKPWRSKSLSTKHTATSSLLSVKQPCPSLEVPPKVIAQKSMLEKLKLFNSSRAPSRASSRASLAEDPEAPDPGRAETCPGHGDSDLGSHQQPAPSLASSPKLALKGIAQRTIVRALANKKISAKALEKGKEKGKPREKEKLPKKSSMVEQDPVKEEVKQEEHAGAETRRSSSVPKGSKTVSSAQPHSSIPKPAGGKGSGAGSKRTMSPSGGKEGDRVHGPRSGTGLSVHKGQLDSRRSSSSSSLGSSEGRCPQRSSGGTTTQSVPGNSIAVGNAVSNGASVQLPQPQPPYSHPNTATVAPFMYRSHTDMDGTALAEAVRDRGEGSLLHSNTIHTSLECLTGEDPEARRLRTVKNIADLRQNLEETMSSLRGTQISHSTLETTFDSSVTTEVTTAAGRSLVHLGGWHAQTLPWRLSSSSPRLQAGDAPSSGSGYSQRSGSGSRLASPNGGRYAGRQSGARHGPRGPELTDTGEELEGITVETTMGYMSDGDVLGKNPRVDSVTSGYMTDGGLSVYPRRLNRLPDSMSTVKETMHPAPPTNQADTDSWDDSSSVSSGISDTLDTDDINTSSSLSSFVNTPSTPHRDLEEQLQTDAEKRSDHGLTWCSEEVRRADAGSDSGVKMDAGSRWCSHPSDISDESDRGSSGRKTPSVSHTGSWRRGMSAQVGITSPRSKAPPLIGCGSLKTHGTGKTDDAKVSEKVCLSPRPNGIHASSSDEARKPPSSARTPTNTFGFKKPLGGMATITASGAVVTSGSATLGKLPKSAGYGGSRLVGRQSSVDDGYLPPNARSLLQYRSLPRPSRSTGTTARYASRTASAGLEPKAIATPPNPRGRGTARPTAETLAPSVTNRTDREKGVCLDSEGLASGQSKASGSGGQDAMPGQCQASRQAGGSMSSPTLRRLFGSKPNGKQAPVTTAENMRNSTVITNPHAPESPPASGPGSAVSPWSSRDGALQPVPDARDASLGKEDAQAPSLHRTSSSRAGVSDSPLPSPAASPKFSRNTLPRRQDRYAHLPQSRGQEEMRDWLRSHSVGGLQESGGVALFPQASNLSSPSGTRLNFNTLGSPTAMAQRSANGLANQDGPYDPHSDPRLRNSSMSLEEKGRTMSNSGSFRDGLEEVHGSCLSLVSSSSSVYSTPEEKSQSEIRKLRRELEASQEKVSALTTQLSANAHLVAAFEQSLGNMTIRLQSLTLTAEQKDSELSELRKTIEQLRKQNTATQAAINGVINSPEPTPKGSANGSPQSPRELRIRRQPSSDSVSSMASGTSLSSVGSASLEFDAKNKNKKKKNWLRSSFKQAFGKKREAPKSASSHSDIEEMTDSSLPSSPKLPYNGPGASVLTKTSLSTALISECADSDAETVMQLRSELRDKEMKLTDIRLEALSSAHQLDQLRESMTRMQAEVEQLKVENDRLKMESQGSSSSRTASQTSISPTSVGLTSQLSLTESTSLDMLLEDSGDGSSRKEGRHVKVVVTLEQEAAWREECRPRQFLIGCIGVSGKTKWDVLDGVVRRLFKEYIIHVDPLGQLGLSADSVQGYGIGDVQRSCEADTPELLPCGYLVGESDTISLSLKGVEANSQDSVAFETLIPKPIFQRYVSQLTEHRRIIFSGPSGTGKTFLATRLAEHMVQREGHNLTDGVIATFNVDHKSSKELKQYLTNLAEQCTSSMGQTLDVPLVVILDNLHQASSLPELLNGLLSSRHHRCPYIIGTMSQATSSTPNLQLHHNFRWVLCANHTEPVKGFLGRFLRRKLMETEISSRVRNSELVKVIDWVPCVWQHLNRFLETHSSSDVTIGPRLFLSCPMDVDGSRVWFTDLWNYSIIPYVLEAVREGLQLYGRRAAWEDPAKWVMESYPWAAGPRQHDWPPLLHLRPEDVGFDGYSLARDGGPRTQPPQEETGGDPLMNMLMRLKEAAHCASPHSYDSDSNSNDHNDDVVESLESTL